MQIDYLCWSIFTRSLWVDEVDFRVDYYLVWSHISIIVKGTLLFQRSFKPKKVIRAVIHNSSARQKRCMHKIGCAYIIIQQLEQTLLYPYFLMICGEEGFICKRVTHWLIRYVCQWCTWAWEASWANSTKKKLHWYEYRKRFRFAFLPFSSQRVEAKRGRDSWKGLL